MRITDQYDPTAIIQIQDSDTALLIVTEECLLEKLQPKPPNNAAFSPFPALNHYGLASNFAGFPNPADNGYSVLLLPKSQFTSAQASAFFLETSMECANLSGPIRVHEFIIPAPAQTKTPTRDTV